MRELSPELRRLHRLAHRDHPRDLPAARRAYLDLLVEYGLVTRDQLQEAAEGFPSGKVPCAWAPPPDEGRLDEAAAEIEAARRAYHDVRRDDDAGR